jgi:hypothetical protein
MATTTKFHLIKSAFSEIGIANYEFDLSAEEVNDALDRLDDLMRSWEARGVSLGWPLTSSPDDSESGQEVTVPDVAMRAIRTNLAIELAPMYGKLVSPHTMATAKSSYNTMLAALKPPPEKGFPSTTPSGAGNSRWWSGSFLPDTEALDVNSGNIQP